MAERPDLRWEEMTEEDYPEGFWMGTAGLDMSRVYGFKVSSPELDRLDRDLAAGNPYRELADSASE